MKKSLLITLVVLCVASNALATTFIVPDDAELVQKSDAIVTGVILSARAVESEDGYVETHYELALDRVLKGPFRPKTKMAIQSPGGSTENRYTIVESSAHFRIGDEVLLFLTAHRGGWTPTDMTLGKFKFAVTSAGHTVAVRDAEDIVGWDRKGNVHREKIRRDAEFLQFIQETVAGRAPIVRDYEADPSDVLAPPVSEPSRLRPVTDLAPAPASTYSVSFYGCAGSSLVRYPARWETATMSAGVQWFKNTNQNASGLTDGGVSIIQTALSAWTSDCESSVNIQYGGTAANLKSTEDGFNMIIFNDPGNHIAGSWGGSGVIATCFSSGNTTHMFGADEFVSFGDSDIIFQNGYAGTQGSIEEAMTHEIGHGIGFRHADKHYLQTCTGCNLSSCVDNTCNASVEDCAVTAIMTASVNTALNYTLQAWDKNAADALYPGTCIVVTAPANVVATATSTSNVSVSWTAVEGALSYNVYRSTNAIDYTLAGSVTAPGVTFNDAARSANTAHLYKVRAVNGGESADSNIDLATTVVFTDDPLVAGTTAIKASHVTEMRTAVNAVRTLAALAAGTYTDSTVTGGITSVKAAHITDLRTAIDQARTALTLSALSYADALVPSASPVKAAHLSELRAGVR